MFKNLIVIKYMMIYFQKLQSEVYIKVKYYGDTIKESKKCIYGRPDGAYRIHYLDWLYNLEYNKKPINSLEELLKQAVKMSEGDK